MTAETPVHGDDAPYVTEDPDTDENAWRRFVRTVAIGVAIGIPVHMGLVFTGLRTISDASTEEALIIAVWTAFWAGVFAGGAAATIFFVARQDPRSREQASSIS